MTRWSSITVQGLDLSLDSTGMVTCRDGRVFVETVHTPSVWAETRRRRHIARQAWHTLDGHVPCLVVVEQPIAFKDRGQTTMKMSALHGVVRDWLWRPGVAVTDVHPSKLKLYGAGRGDASKEAMLEASRRELTPHFGWANDHNQADAMWLACMGLHHIGQSPIEPTLQRAQTLVSLTWPDLDAVPA